MSEWICKDCGTRADSRECPACGSQHMVPVDTPVGKELAGKYGSEPHAAQGPTGGGSRTAIGMAVLVGFVVGLILVGALLGVLHFTGAFDRGSGSEAAPPTTQAPIPAAATVPAPAPPGEEPVPPESQARTAAPAPKAQPSIVSSKARDLAKEAEEALTLAEHHRFGPAFQLYDTFDSRLAQLELKANTADSWAVDRAKKQVAYSKAEMQRIAGEWARPKYDEGLATFLRATDGMDDEEGIIQAYVTIAPALPFRKYMPSDVKNDLNGLVWQCQENLDDEEWARAQALGRANQK